jgi:hypothetical protein
MPVRRVSAEEMLGGKTLVMSANSSTARKLKALHDAVVGSEPLAAAADASREKQNQR